MGRSLFNSIILMGLSCCVAGPAAFAQLPVLRSVAPQPPARSVAPAIVPTEAVSVAPAAATEYSVAGQIARTKQVDVRPAGDKVVAVVLDTGDGRQQIVDLGPALNWKSRPLHIGDQITVRGPVVTLGDAQVLIAGELYAAGENILIRRVPPPAAVAVESSGYSVSDQMLRIDARLDNLRTAGLRGSIGEHLMAEATDRRGEVLVVDLGSPAALWRADLKPQDWIRIEGQLMKVNNRPVLLALEINKEGVPYMIGRDVVRQAPVVATP
jgi:hypothetical protein